MIGVIDYKAGNIASVTNALTHIGAPYVVSHDPHQLEKCEGVILPGVGAAPGAIESLREYGLIDFLKTSHQPVLGICLGMQLLYEQSEEGATTCLGVISNTVKKFNNAVMKIPHMGWNDVVFTSSSPLQAGIENGEYFYFAHSFYIPITAETKGTSSCGVPFAAMVQKENYFGVQFHPEKSGKAGLQLLNNFVAICKSYRR